MIQFNSSLPQRSSRRRSFVQAAEAMVGSVALLCGPQAVLAADAPDHPNVIFILTDDLGYGDVGVFFQNARAAAGNPADPWHLTPHIDNLASEGVELFQHYCPAPVCAPSRASLILGVTQGHANVRDNQFDKAIEDNHTLATVMDRTGYATVAIGKWGLQGDGSRWSTDPPGETNPATWMAFPTKRRFDDFFGYARHSGGHEHYPKEGVYEGTKQVWDGTNDITPELDKCYTADLWTAWAKQWIVNHEATNASQPFFMYLAYDTPHAVIELPTQAYPAGGGLTGGVQWLGTPGHMINTASGTVDSYIDPQYANATYHDDNNLATPEVPWPDIYKRYATSVQRIDDGTPQPLSIQSVTQPYGGTNQIVSGKILYTPTTKFLGQDHFQYRITDVKLYVDGALETFSALSSQAVDTQANGDMKIGCDMQNRYFDGTIDELRLYKWALSASEIAALAAATNQCADAWYYRYYGTATPDWNGDSDGDGFSQFAEYAFGGDPRVPDEPLKVQASVVAGHLQIAYPRLISGTSDLIDTLEVSSDLQNWTPLAGTKIGTVPVASPVGYEMAAFEAANPTSSQSPQFVRVRVSQ